MTQVRPDPSQGLQGLPNENVKEDVKAAVGKFKGRVPYEEGEMRLRFDQVLGSIIFHWRQELRDFEWDATSADKKTSWARAFRDWDHEQLPNGRTLPDEFQIIDVEVNEIPLGLRSVRPELHREKEYEVYSRLFWQYFYFKSNVMPKSKWPNFWVASKRDSYSVTLKTLPWFAELKEYVVETADSNEQSSNGNESEND